MHLPFVRNPGEGLIESEVCAMRQYALCAGPKAPESNLQ